MNITDPAMLKKMERALKEGGDLFTLEDISGALASGRMQSHVYGNTWIITQVFNYPRKKSVDILFVVGNLGESLEAENRIEEWAKNIGADMITATGRDGWWKFNTLGWDKVGTVYSKDINHE